MLSTNSLDTLVTALKDALHNAQAAQQRYEADQEAIRRLKKELQTQKASMALATAEILDLRKQLADSKTLAAQSKSKSDKLISALTSQNTELQAEITRVKSELHRYATIFSKSQSRSPQNYVHRIETLVQTNAKLQKANQELQKKLETKNVQIQQLQRHIGALQAKLDARATTQSTINDRFAEADVAALTWHSQLTRGSGRHVDTSTSTSRKRPAAVPTEALTPR